MARVVDITDKLTFEGNPTLVIKGKSMEVNCGCTDDAEGYGADERRAGHPGDPGRL